MQWAPQITVPMPLKAINEIASPGDSDTRSVLSSSKTHENMVKVTKKFFQSSPNGVSPDDVGDDTLGFFSLVMSYAKAAHQSLDESVKVLTSTMPRTDFTTMFNLISSDITGDLYDIVKILACYKNSGDGVE